MLCIIDIKYKKIYDKFIKKHEEIYVNPWHEIDKVELDNISNDLINNMDINNEYNFNYFNPFMNIEASSKEEYSNLSEEAKKNIIYYPDFLVEETKEDYISGIDIILEYALNYSKTKYNELLK